MLGGIGREYAVVHVATDESHEMKREMGDISEIDQSMGCPPAKSKLYINSTYFRM